MKSGQPRRARVYDRLEGQEPGEPARRRFGEVDAAAESLRPGSIVALAFECDELLAAQRATTGNGWVLSSVCTDWSSRGTSGWHTHAGDYAVESLEPSCMFRVLRDGPLIALASIAANGLLLCATGNGDSLGLTACNGGTWAGAGAAWERRDGAIYNSRWADKVLAVRLLHITCLPTMQLQRVEEFYGGLLHEMHAERSSAVRRAKELETERDTVLAEAHTWRRQAEDLEQQVQLLRERTPAPPQRLGAAPLGAAPELGTSQELPPAGVVPPLPDVSLQLAALQQQLESLAAEGLQLPQLQQERTRMGICLRTIKEITELVRQSSACPSSNGSPSLDQTEVTAGPHMGRAGDRDSPEPPPGPFAADSEGESRLVDFLGSRPEEGDPLARVLDPPPAGSGRASAASSPQRRVLRSLAENSLSSLGDPEGSCQQQELESSSPDGVLGPPQGASVSAPGSSLKASRTLPPLPLSEKLSMAVQQLAMGSPHTADGVAQYLATSTNLRASQQRLAGATRLRSSFLQRPPAAVEDLYYR